jgi:hypothetical protein
MGIRIVFRELAPEMKSIFQTVQSYVCFEANLRPKYLCSCPRSRIGGNEAAMTPVSATD